MVNILALEAASQSCSVTLKTSSSTEHLHIDEARSHSQHFLPSIRSLLEQHSLATTNIDVIACGNGPGSFTGLRICFAMAQGLAYGLNIPLLTVPSLIAMAYSYRQQVQGGETNAISILDARMGEVYLGEFQISTKEVQSVGALQLLAIKDARDYVEAKLAQSESRYALVGPGVDLLDLPTKLPPEHSLYPNIQPHSSAVADIAMQRWLAGEAPSANAAEICYLRNSVSWDKRKRVRP